MENVDDFNCQTKSSENEKQKGLVSFTLPCAPRFWKPRARRSCVSSEAKLSMEILSLTNFKKNLKGGREK